MYKVASKLENFINTKNIFANEYAQKIGGNAKNAWITILNDLLNIDGRNSAEGLGIYAFKPDLDVIDDNFIYIPTLFEHYGLKLNLSKEEFKTYLYTYINSFRVVPAIEYEDAALTYEEKKEEFSYRMFDNYVMLRKGHGSAIIDPVDHSDVTNRIKSLLPVNTNTTNKLLSYTMKIFNTDASNASTIIEVVFLMLNKLHILDTTNGLAGHLSQDVARVSAGKFSLYGPKITKWYQCNKCKELTLYNLFNVCPNCGANELNECDPNQVFKDNYYRNEYINKKIERLVFKEHTGQLQSREASRIQEEFRKKHINVLSCSTTFEMGVDIGSLETVFMRNVPPTPANYVQRAGRAGRGKDSSAFVLTFCGNSSHDYNYFSDPEKMISGRIMPPIFKINNKKIVLRHIIDASLSFYLHINPNDFYAIGSFIDHYQIYVNYINSRPADLGRFIDDFIKNANIKEYENFGWIDDAIGNEGILNRFNKEFLAEVDELNDLAEKAFKGGNTELGGYYKKEIDKKRNQAFIDALANANIIPKYGFPVDVVNLKTDKNNSKVDLNRDLQIALSEYAPESEVIADGIKYTSRYINLPRSGSLTKYYYFKCCSCGRINYSINKDSLDKCEVCGAVGNKGDKYFIIPDKGFRVDEHSSTSRTIKPKKVYSNEVEYVGKGIPDETINYKDLLNLVSNKDDELIVTNDNPFYMCEKCGYTVIDKLNYLSKQKEITKKHNAYKAKCSNTSLKLISLGYRFKTDVVKLEFKNIYSESESLSFMYALLDGISTAFDIERNDISGVLAKEANGTVSIVLYDDVPGGAGYVKRLMDVKNFEKALDEALRKIKNCTCDIHTSCYNCLRNYRNQKKHNLLVRLSAIRVLENLLK